MISYKELYFDMLKHQKNIIEDTFKDTNIKCLSGAFVLQSDYESWLACISSSTNISMYKTAIEEYNKALFLMTCGFYRQAYMSLRFFLEHTLFGLYLSVNEFNYRLWKQNNYDIKWSSIMDSDTGLFSSNFFTAFSLDLLNFRIELQEISKSVYRELSEYIHGNLAATKQLPTSNVYDKAVINDFANKIEVIRYLVIFLFFVRYKDELDLDKKIKLEHSIMDAIGRHPEVEAYFMTIAE